MKIIEETKLDFDDVLIRPKHSTLESRQNVILEREFQFYHSTRKWNGIPICISNMSGTGRFEVANIASQYKIVTCLHKHYSLEDLVANFNNNYIPNNLTDYVWYSLGIKNEEYNKLIEFIKQTNFQPNIVLDIANGHIESFNDKIKELRNISPDSIICAGNVVIPECVFSSILSGADIIKIGMGSGNQCRSRLETSVGYPQLSCNIECSEIAHGMKNGDRRLGLVCSDGGIRRIGHFATSFCSGSDFTMSGTFFAGTDPTGEKEDWEYDENNLKKHLNFFGMASKEAQDRYSKGVPQYGVAEGRCSKIEFKGKLEILIENILGGLRSTATYIGANNLRDFNKCGTFLKVNRIVSY